jgi:hypothetical protein
MSGSAPNQSRTIVLPVKPSVGFSLAWPTADPGDMLDYGLDITAWLADAGTTITQVDATASPLDGVIQLPSYSFSGGVITVQIGGGAVGTTYAIGITVILASGEHLHRGIALPIAALTQSVSVPADALTVNGLPLSVLGNPLEAG